jgi:NADPH:quinone reductase-like Zn-dependent oxidoreductase
MSLNPLTAFGLVESSQAELGDWIVLTAAASTVSRLVASICRARGIKVLGIVRSPIDHATARCNADAVLSSSDPTLGESITKLTAGRAVALLDSVGGTLLSQLLPVLAGGARVLAYGVQDKTPVPITNAMLIYSNLTWIGFGIDRWLSRIDGAHLRAAQESLWTMLRDGTLQLPIASLIPLKDFRQGLAADSASGRLGKVLLI